MPKDIRDALGLEPGQRVGFELDADGNARIYKADDGPSFAARKSEILNRLRDVQAEFRQIDTYPDSGMDGLAYQRWLRGNEFGE